MPNEVIKYKGYYVSYNANPHLDAGCIEDIYNAFAPLAGVKQKETGKAETALVVNGKFLILDGDHRKQYEKAGSLAECLAYFKQHQVQKSAWSDDL